MLLLAGAGTLEKYGTGFQANFGKTSSQQACENACQAEYQGYYDACQNAYPALGEDCDAYANEQMSGLQNCIDQCAPASSSVASSSSSFACTGECNPPNGFPDGGGCNVDRTGYGDPTLIEFCCGGQYQCAYGTGGTCGETPGADDPPYWCPPPGGGSSSSAGSCPNVWNEECADGEDNDGDSLVDAGDPGCWMDPTNPATYNANLNHENRATTECQDSKDNEGDGLMDDIDPGCWTDPDDSSTYDGTLDDESEATSQCQDGLDNDGDAAKDELDPGCQSIVDNDESQEEPECSDDVDNDGDLEIDVTDGGCVDGLDTVEEDGQPQCSDGVDNDSDGLVDMGNGIGWGRDMGCSDGSDNTESATLPYGQLDTPSPACTTVRGFACVPGSGPITVRVYNANTGLLVDEVTADDAGEARIATYCGGQTSRRFSVTLPQYPQTDWAVQTYAVVGGSEYLLGETPVYCPVEEYELECADGIDNDFDGAADYPNDIGCTSADDDGEYNGSCDDMSSSSSVASLLQCNENGLIDFEDLAPGTPIHQQYRGRGVELEAECYFNGQYHTDEECMEIALQGSRVMMVPPSKTGEGSEVTIRFIDPVATGTGAGIPAIMQNVSFNFGTVGDGINTVIDAYGPDYFIHITISNGVMTKWVNGGAPVVTDPFTSGDLIDLGGPISEILIQSA